LLERLFECGTNLIEFAATLIVCTTITTTSTFAANPDQGENLVKRWCAGCHLVAADQKAARTDAPTFASVAARPDFDPAKLAFFLLDPHAKMPNMQLNRDESVRYRRLYRDTQVAAEKHADDAEHAQSRTFRALMTDKGVIESK
jgi:mono/diheme cytochrome c family protein